MSIQINFLRQRRKVVTSLQNNDRRYAVLLSYITGGIALTALGLAIFQFYLTTQLQSTKKKQVDVQRQITSLASVELEYLTLGQKFSEIQTLVKDKSLRQTAIEFFTALFAQQGITLSEVHFESDGVVRFQVSSTNVFQLKQFMAILQSKDVLSRYPELILSDLSRERSGVYNTSVAVVLPIVTQAPLPPKKTIQLPEEIVQ